MQYSRLVQRIAGDGADAWLIHYAALAAQERGEDVILLSVGDPDLDTPAPVLERAIERLRAGDTHYTPATGRDTCAKRSRSRMARVPVSGSTQTMSSFSRARKTPCSPPRCASRAPAMK